MEGEGQGMDRYAVVDGAAALRVERARPPVAAEVERFWQRPGLSPVPEAREINR